MILNVTSISTEGHVLMSNDWTVCMLPVVLIHAMIQHRCYVFYVYVAPNPHIATCSLADWLSPLIASYFISLRTGANRFQTSLYTNTASTWQNMQKSCNHNEIKCGGFYITKKNGTQHACRCSKVWCVNMIIHLHWRGWKHGNQYNYFLDLAIAFNTHLMTHCEIMASESNKFTSEIRMLWSSVLLSQNTSSLHWCPVHTLQGMPQVAATAMHMLYRLRSTMQ